MDHFASILNGTAKQFEEAGDQMTDNQNDATSAFNAADALRKLSQDIIDSTTEEKQQWFPYVDMWGFIAAGQVAYGDAYMISDLVVKEATQRFREMLAQGADAVDFADLDVCLRGELYFYPGRYEDMRILPHTSPVQTITKVGTSKMICLTCMGCYNPDPKMGVYCATTRSGSHYYFCPRNSDVQEAYHGAIAEEAKMTDD